LQTIAERRTIEAITVSLGVWEVIQMEQSRHVTLMDSLKEAINEQHAPYGVLCIIKSKDVKGVVLSIYS
jgi:hypothetical protein